MNRIASPGRILAASVLMVTLLAAQPANAVSFRMSQIGYHTKGDKVLVIDDVPAETPIEHIVLFNPDKRNPKMPLKVGIPVFEVTDPKVFSSETGQGPGVKSILVDFSAFQIAGNDFEIRIEGTDIKSPPIVISDFLYWDTLKPVLKSFYFQRCGQDVEDRELRIYHASCHLDDADDLRSAHPADMVGGWHNGADYAKYVTSTAMSASRILAMWEWSPKPFRYFHLEYPLTEPSLGKERDVLHEARAGLEWLLSMQRRDGAVYRKIAGKQKVGNIRPEDDRQARFFYGASTPDTANFAAVMAQASRSFSKDDLGFSVKTLRAAEKAWLWLEQNPTLSFERSQSDFAGSGEFWSGNLQTDRANRVWAAAELYASTGNSKYHRYFLANYNKVPVDLFSWANPALQGYADYLLYAPDKNEEAVASLHQRITVLANGVVDGMKASTWPSGLSKYGRASNQQVVERAALLLTAARLESNESYRNAASRSLSYLFGVNPLGLSYVTGVGTNAVKHPSHRFMQTTDKTMPGYLVAGPNEDAPEADVPKKAGASSYVDKAEATSVNESTILYNAGLVYVLGLLNNAYNLGNEAPDQGPVEIDPREMNKDEPGPTPLWQIDPNADLY